MVTRNNTTEWISYELTMHLSGVKNVDSSTRFESLSSVA